MNILIILNIVLNDFFKKELYSLKQIRNAILNDDLQLISICQALI